MLVQQLPLLLLLPLPLYAWFPSNGWHKSHRRTWFFTNVYVCTLNTEENWNCEHFTFVYNGNSHATRFCANRENWEWHSQTQALAQSSHSPAKQMCACVKAYAHMSVRVYGSMCIGVNICLGKTECIRLRLDKYHRHIHTCVRVCWVCVQGMMGFCTLNEKAWNEKGEYVYVYTLTFDVIRTFAYSSLESSFLPSSYSSFFLEEWPMYTTSPKSNNNRNNQPKWWLDSFA